MSIDRNSPNSGRSEDEDTLASKIESARQMPGIPEAIRLQEYAERLKAGWEDCLTPHL